MADTFTPNLNLTKMENGTHNNTWNDVYSSNYDFIDAKLGSKTSISTTGGTTTLTESQQRVAVIDVSGALVANATIEFSTRGGFWIVRNNTTGNFTLTTKVSGQTGVQVTQGKSALVWGNGTDIIKATEGLAAQGVNGNSQVIRNYDSTTTSSLGYFEQINNRGDGNSTFEGRYGAALRRTDGVAITGTPASPIAIGGYFFGAQHGTAAPYDATKLLYSAGIVGLAESTFSDATHMSTGISFRTGSTGDLLGSANLTYGTERMRLSNAGGFYSIGGSSAGGDKGIGTLNWGQIFEAGVALASKYQPIGSYLSGTVAIGNGGTGQTTAAAGARALLNGLGTTALMILFNSLGTWSAMAPPGAGADGWYSLQLFRSGGVNQGLAWNLT